MHDERTDTSERRAGDRAPLQGDVIVELEPGSVSGSGQNVSPSGVYLVADRAPRLLVRLPGEDEPRTAELVRLENLAPGQIGYAIRFS